MSLKSVDWLLSLVGSLSVTATAVAGVNALAQVTEKAVGMPMPDVTNISAIGLVMWLVWYQTTKAGPKKDALHEAVVEKLCETFASDSKAQREESTANRVAFERAVDVLEEKSNRLARHEEIAEMRITKGVSSTKPGDSGIGRKG